VSINVGVAPVGTPAVQLKGVNQLEEIAPVQVVCARADVVASNAAATTVVANKVRISSPLAPAHKRAAIVVLEKVRGQYLTAGGVPIYSGRDFPATCAQINLT
jgi:hypothetical protein